MILTYLQLRGVVNQKTRILYSQADYKGEGFSALSPDRFFDEPPNSKPHISLLFIEGSHH